MHERQTTFLRDCKTCEIFSEVKLSNYTTRQLVKVPFLFDALPSNACGYVSYLLSKLHAS